MYPDASGVRGDVVLSESAGRADSSRDETIARLNKIIRQKNATIQVGGWMGGGWVGGWMGWEVLIGIARFELAWLRVRRTGAVVFLELVCR